MPTVTICSREFYYLGKAESKALGMPSLPIVQVPHPFGVLEQRLVREEAGKVVDEIIKSLTSPPGR